MVIIQIIYNLAILVAMSVISGFIANRFDINAIKSKLLQGIVFGTAAIIGMLYPFVLKTGIIFDGRSVVLSICALFFGPIPAVISGITASIFRLYLGGAGAIMGISVIIASVIIGLLFNYLVVRKNNKKTILILYTMGILVHIAMLMLMAFLPKEFVWETFKTISFTVMVFYPLATVLIGKILNNQEDNSRLMHQLKESEEKYKLLAENSADPIILLDLNLNHLFVSQSVFGLYGYTAEEYMKLNVDKTVTAESLKKVRKVIYNELIFANDRTADIDKHSTVILDEYTKDGSIKCVESTIKIVRDEENNPKAILLVSRDITERMKSEEIIRKTNEELQSIIQYNPMAIQIVNKDGYTQEANAAFAKLFANKIPLNYSVFDGTFFKQPEINKLMEKTKRGEIVYFPDFIYNPSFLALNLPNIDIWLRMVVFSLKNNLGIPEKYILMYDDITESRKSQSALIESERNYREIFNATTDAIFIHDSQSGIILDVNESMLKMYGYGEKQEIKNFTTGDLSAVEEEYTDTRAKEKIIEANENNLSSFEWKAKRKNGDVFWAEVSLQSTQIGGEGRTLAVVRDITERKRLEESLQRRIIALTRPLETDEVIDFSELFRLEEIQNIQDAFADIADVASLITYPDGRQITKPSNFCQLCDLIRSTEKGLKKCLKTGNLMTTSENTTTIMHCFGSGLYETVATITVGGKHIANWIIGQVKS